MKGAQAVRRFSVLGILFSLAASIGSPAGADDTWNRAAPLSIARYDHAVGVVDGIVYAVGGSSINNNEILGAVEGYDPTINAWATQASISIRRTGLAVGVVDGLLYAVGGLSIFASGAVEAFNPVTNSWSLRASMLTARYQLGVGVVNGILYAVGGNTSAGYTATVEAFDPATNTWTARSPMTTARAGLAVGVVNGKLYAVGGYNNGGTVATVEVYDPVTDTWVIKSSMPTARSGLAVGVVGDILYAVGGYYFGVVAATVEAYDPVTDTWTTKAPMPTARYNFAVGVVSPMIYAVGGNTSVCCYEIVRTVEAYTAPVAPPNLPPTAVPGSDQPIHVGQAVTLNGSASFDDNTIAELLHYAWAIVSKPAGSAATLANPNAAAPSFVVDAVGTYIVQLIVTDEGGLSSAAATVTVSSSNMAPTANAGDAQALVVGQMATLNGSGSSDPDGDALAYSWSFVDKPLGSVAVLAGAATPTPSFTPDVAGQYTAGLLVNDGFGDSPQAQVIISVISVADYAQARVADALNYTRSLPVTQFKAPGHKQAITNLLSQAIAALQAGDIAEARSKINAALSRADGYPVRGVVDTQRPGMDWVTDAGAQSVIHLALRDALEILPDKIDRGVSGQNCRKDKVEPHNKHMHRGNAPRRGGERGERKHRT